MSTENVDKMCKMGCMLC